MLLVPVQTLTANQIKLHTYGTSLAVIPPVSAYRIYVPVKNLERRSLTHKAQRNLGRHHHMVALKRVRYKIEMKNETAVLPLKRTREHTPA